MKKSSLFVLSLIATSAIAQQSFSGLRNGAYSGTHQVLSNPSNIVGSPRKWDVNLFSIDGTFNSNIFQFESANLKKGIKNFTDLNQLNNNVTAGGVLDILTPSASFQIGKKNAVAITTRSRVFANLDNVDAKFIETIVEDEVKNISNLPYSRQFENQNILLNGFTEAGLTWATTLFSTPNHKINAGITAKYVMGWANLSGNIDRLSATIEGDENANKIFITNAKGRVEYIASGIDFQDFKFEKVSDELKNNSAYGLGFDFGLSYEYRNNADDEKYRLKAGIAVTDIGHLKYKHQQNRSAIYDISAVAGQKFLLSDIEKSLKDPANGVFEQPFTDENYQISLPTAIQSNIDVRFSDNWYVEISALKGISKKNENNKNPYYSDEIILTPRYENKFFGFFVPLKYNEVSKFNAGAALRLGPVFVGSSSILSNFTKGKQLDVFFGIRFGV